MDYQSMGQMPNPAPSPMPNQPMGEEAKGCCPNSMWYAVAAVAVIALGVWYFYWGKAPAPAPLSETQASVVDQTEIPALSGGNTTADISADLSQIPDTSATLDADAAAAAAAISGL